MRDKAFTIKAGAATVICLVAFGAALSGRRPTVDVFDVGQGDAILVQCGTKQMLVDGGPDATVLSKLGRTLPLFDRHLDVVVLTHPHADHYIGLIPVLERYRVDRLLVAGMDGSAPEYASFLDAATRAGLVPVAVRSGDRITLGSCVAADVLWPPVGATTDDPNDASAVLRLARTDSSSPRAAMMLMGDATAEAERALLERSPSLAADVLKAGHHGSRFSTSAALIDAVLPKTAVISVGKNSYGHPSGAALMRLKSRAVRVLRTDEDGDVRIVIGQDRAFVSRF